MMGKLRSPSFRPRRPSSFFRYIVVAVIILFGIYTLTRKQQVTQYVPPPPSEEKPVDGTTQGHPDYPPKASERLGPHPIDKLIENADKTFDELLSKESKTLEEAAQAYRQRRGRHPPPGFDKWWAFTSKHDGIVVEDFFDQIYQDLGPFWGITPAVIRKESWSYEMKIHIRNHKTNTTSDWPWTLTWQDMIDSIVDLLPDMDIPLNAMDEPRLVTPWEDINTYMEKASNTFGFPTPDEVTSTFQSLPRPSTGDMDTIIPKKKWEEDQAYWPIVRRGCPPDSRARSSEVQLDFNHYPVIESKNAEDYMYEGFVANYSLSRDLCNQPDLQGLEGLIINPLSVSSTKVLFPMFGGSKLGINNEILLPPPVYWSGEERFTGGDYRGGAWSRKSDKVVWRGVATGGRNLEDNWRGFHRHRFVAMNNGTKLQMVESGVGKTENFALPEDKYQLPAVGEGGLSKWVEGWADVGFVDLMCTPNYDDGTCYYTDLYFHPVEGLKMKEQFRYKYVPDIDGNSFSGRYLGFLRSTSLPIKATLFKEWLDNRLVPWKHFVPMDNRFVDYYGIMDYFLGYNGKNSHDSVAEKMAMEGKQWAEKVLRKEDMQIYTLRLLLEYARLLDDKRENLGWVEDAKKDPSLKKTWKNWAK